ncbi:hypothetical protein T01_10425 [Trichinella spiralis]|uniref:Uncharacterized protein n=1 Tax=Trichinella spiralis TaxID=6334 RepID=A0A0V1BFP9_TRISP|nr:hypothetical protein T01_10425 [Trichinella spiralis]
MVSRIAFISKFSICKFNLLQTRLCKYQLSGILDIDEKKQKQPLSLKSLKIILLLDTCQVDFFTPLSATPKCINL